MSRGKLKAVAPNQGIRIRAEPGDTGSTQLQNVRLSFEHFGSDCVDGCQVTCLKAWTEKLKRLTASTWQTVHQTRRESLGCENMPRAQLKFPIPPACHGRDEFMSFRCSGDARMIGYRDGAVLYVLWVAPGSGSYDH